MQRGALDRWILTLLREHCIRITPTDLSRRIQKAFSGVTRSQIRKVLGSLLANGDIIYTHHYNITHIELGGLGLTSMSDRVILAPPSGGGKASPRQVIVRLHDGAAFGMGDHPTTRLMLKGIDYVIGRVKPPMASQRAFVLAIAAAGLGMNRVLAVDLDPLACRAAASNIRLNGVQDRVTVTRDIRDHLPEGGYAYIFANLRPPTLRQLFPTMLELSADNAMWVLSGFRKKADGFIGKGLQGLKYHPLWTADSCGWGASALAVERKAFPG